MRSKAALLAVALGVAAPLAAQQQPMSAIDWLTSGDGTANMPSVARPGLSGTTVGRPATRIPRDEPPVASSGNSPEVEVSNLDAPSPEAVGLLPMSVTGLPRDLWRQSDAATVAQLVRGVDPAVPALSALLYTLLLAEADPPRGSAGQSLLSARLDRLLAEGAVEPGLALIERAGGDTNPALFRRWFDLALLGGDPEQPCNALRAEPALSGDLAQRIYCDARLGDWAHADTVLATARLLGSLSERDAELLSRFLEPALVEGAEPVPPPAQPTPLQFRLFEAVGEALPTQPLPRAFAAADLNGTSGWRAQLLAAERLAQTGALSANRLLGIYSDRRPAASGGVWDRVAAVQRLETAIASGRADLVGPALTRAWAQMRAAGLLVPLSELFGAALSEIPLEGRAAVLAQRAALLSPDYEAAAREMTPATPALAAARSIASGNAPQPLPGGPLAEALARAWDDPTPPAAIARLLQQGKLGESILQAMSLFATGAEGNHGDLTEALAVLRLVGLEDSARRAAIQLLVLTDDGAPL